MKGRYFSPAHTRALAALPEDGSWLIGPQAGLGAAFNSLEFYHDDLCETEYGDFGKRNGRCARRRLTPAGIAVRKKAPEL
jgi:hypothetical protein